MSLTLYQGNTLSTKKESKEFGIDPYIPSDTLRDAVQLAQVLQQPLLVKGEPGCGKSRLAKAIAAELHKSELDKYYFEWNVKSTSKAQDGLYIINNLKRLSDANIRWDSASKKSDNWLDLKLNNTGNGNYSIKDRYIELGVIGKAFQASRIPGLQSPPVILIDEIDKADIDFPNDLLLELDKMEFTIPEATDQDGQPVTIKANADLRPLFIITSNDEKPLPAAFLRRCLFHYIKFSEIKLKDIVEARYPNLAQRTGLVDGVLDSFKVWRDKIEKKGTGNKNITTSELLDWLKMIDYYIKQNNKEPEYNKDGSPVYHQALLKDYATVQLFMREEKELKPA
jgi:MoxR-like ATPase